MLYTYKNIWPRSKKKRSLFFNEGRNIEWSSWESDMACLNVRGILQSLLKPNNNVYHIQLIQANIPMTIYHDRWHELWTIYLYTNNKFLLIIFLHRLETCKLQDMNIFNLHRPKPEWSVGLCHCLNDFPTCKLYISSC